MEYVVPPAFSFCSVPRNVADIAPVFVTVMCTMRNSPCAVFSTGASPYFHRRCGLHLGHGDSVGVSVDLLLVDADDDFDVEVGAAETPVVSGLLMNTP